MGVTLSLTHAHYAMWHVGRQSDLVHTVKTTVYNQKIIYDYILAFLRHKIVQSPAKQFKENWKTAFNLANLNWVIFS